MGSKEAEHAPAITIPVINISPYVAPNPSLEATSSIARSIHAAARSPGFFQVVGHDVSTALRTRLLERMTAFFTLPPETKTALHRHRSPAMRGYEGVGDQRLEPAFADRKEGFTVGAENNDDDYGLATTRKKFLQGANQWPAEEACPGFHEAVMEYFAALRGLSRTMFRLVALSLGLEEGWFDDFVGSEDSIAICRVHRYPPTTPELAETTRGIGAHTDFGALTLLLQDDVGGLEVLHRPTQTWHPVEPVPDAFVVNIGDMMARWTNELYTSTLHRVISPVSDKHRYSVAFFNEGRLDQVIECIPTCLEPGEQPKYEPVQVEAHLRKRYGGSY